MLGIFHLFFLVDSRREMRERDKAELAYFLGESTDLVRVAMQASGGIYHP
jgi:hypothetical protein